MKKKNQEEGINSFAGGSLQCKMQTVTDFQQGDRLATIEKQPMTYPSQKIHLHSLLLTLLKC